MNAMLTPYRVEAGFWLILLVGLATGIGIITDWGRQMQLPITQVAGTPLEFPKPALADPFHLPDADQFLDITLRPLFIVTRRPPPAAPPPEPPKPSMQKGQFILTGTIVAAEGKFAFLLEKAGNKRWSIAEGKQINGIMVKEITKERVVLSQYDDTEVLVLRANTPPPGVLPAARVAPGAPPAGGVAPGAPPAGGVAPGAPPAGGVAPGPMPSPPGGGIGLRPLPGPKQ